MKIGTKNTPVMATRTLSSMLPNLYTGIGWRLSLLLAPHELYLSFIEVPMICLSQTQQQGCRG